MVVPTCNPSTRQENYTDRKKEKKREKEREKETGADFFTPGMRDKQTPL